MCKRAEHRRRCCNGSGSPNLRGSRFRRFLGLWYRFRLRSLLGLGCRGSLRCKRSLGCYGSLRRGSLRSRRLLGRDISGRPLGSSLGRGGSRCRGLGRRGIGSVARGRSHISKLSCPRLVGIILRRLHSLLIGGESLSVSALIVGRGYIGGRRCIRRRIRVRASILCLDDNTNPRRYAYSGDGNYHIPDALGAIAVRHRDRNGHIVCIFSGGHARRRDRGSIPIGRGSLALGDLGRADITLGQLIADRINRSIRLLGALLKSRFCRSRSFNRGILECASFLNLASFLVKKLLYLLLKLGAAASLGIRPFLHITSLGGGDRALLILQELLSVIFRIGILGKLSVCNRLSLLFSLKARRPCLIPSAYRICLCLLKKAGVFSLFLLRITVDARHTLARLVKPIGQANGGSGIGILGNDRNFFLICHYRLPPVFPNPSNSIQTKNSKRRGAE